MFTIKYDSAPNYEIIFLKKNRIKNKCIPILRLGFNCSNIPVLTEDQRKNARLSYKKYPKK